jgi:hypothetical protein
MTPQSPPAPELDQTPQSVDASELESRIRTIEELDDAALGSFTSLDWVIVVVGSLLIPGVILWWVA